jgi:hypothetical protein
MRDSTLMIFAAIATVTLLVARDRAGLGLARPGAGGKDPADLTPDELRRFALDIPPPGYTGPIY